MFASVVQDFEKATAFYRDKLGFEARINPWNADEGENLGTPGARLGTADVTIPGTNLFWRFGQLEGVDRRAHTPRIADPGAGGWP